MIEVTSVTWENGTNSILITGTDLDALWIRRDFQDSDSLPELTYKFDVTAQGHQKYLYVITKNNKKANQAISMYDRINALVGEIINFSDNFLLKEEP